MIRDSEKDSPFRRAGKVQGSCLFMVMKQQLRWLEDLSSLRRGALWSVFLGIWILFASVLPKMDHAQTSSVPIVGLTFC